MGAEELSAETIAARFLKYLQNKTSAMPRTPRLSLQASLPEFDPHLVLIRCMQHLVQGGFFFFLSHLLYPYSSSTTARRSNTASAPRAARVSQKQVLRVGRSQRKGAAPRIRDHSVRSPHVSHPPRSLLRHRLQRLLRCSLQPHKDAFRFDSHDLFRLPPILFNASTLKRGRVGVVSMRVCLVSSS